VYNKIVDLKIKMLEEEWCEMGKLVRNVEFWQFGHNRDKRSSLFIFPKADRMRNTSVMNEFYRKIGG